MGKLVRFLGGVAIGAALGLGVSMLVAPQSGKGLIQSIKARRDEAIEAARAESAERERELRAEWQARINAERIKREALKG